MNDQPEKMVEMVAKALFDHAVKRAHEEMSQIELPFEKLKQVARAIRKASDRETAIVIFCLLDDLCVDFFKQKLVGEIAQKKDEPFFGGNGVLSTAHSRFALLAGLEWISSSVFSDIKFIRKCRNEFAHDINKERFDQRPTSDLLAKFVLTKKL